MVLTKDKQNIYQEAIRQWGKDAQLDMVIEELGELIVVIQHSRRLEKWEKVATNDELLGEIADVEIMLEQLKYMINADGLRLFQIKEKKLERVKKLLGI